MGKYFRFLTLFCNCLPHPTVLRVWDLIFLEGNEVLLRTALAIWQVLAQRILSVRTADEFYCMMGALTRELLESNLIDANTLIKAIVAIGPLKELKNLRDHYLYNITPWGTSMPRPVEKQISLHPKHNIPLDISSLKKQYLKLKQRQRQAHVIFSSAISGQPATAPTIAINHLLVGKRALGETFGGEKIRAPLEDFCRFCKTSSASKRQHSSSPANPPQHPPVEGRRKTELQL